MLKHKKRRIQSQTQKEQERNWRQKQPIIPKQNNAWLRQSLDYRELACPTSVTILLDQYRLHQLRLCLFQQHPLHPQGHHQCQTYFQVQLIIIFCKKFLLLKMTELEFRNMLICHFQGLRRQLAWEAITLMVSLDPPYQHPQFAKMFPSLPTH